MRESCTPGSLCRCRRGRRPDRLRATAPCGRRPTYGQGRVGDLLLGPAFGHTADTAGPDRPPLAHFDPCARESCRRATSTRTRASTMPRDTNRRDTSEAGHRAATTARRARTTGPRTVTHGLRRLDADFDVPRRSRTMSVMSSPRSGLMYPAYPLRAPFSPGSFPGAASDTTGIACLAATAAKYHRLLFKPGWSRPQ
jgi:hypothetical protein